MPKLVELCPCCNYPLFQEGVVEKFNFCDDSKQFASGGIGVYLYFFYLQYIFIIFAILFGSGAIPYIIMGVHYKNEVLGYCSNFQYNQTNACVNASNSVEMNSWLFAMSYASYSNIISKTNIEL